MQLRQGLVVGGAFRIGDRLQYVVVDADLLERLPSGLRMVGGDQRDRFSLIPHQILASTGVSWCFRP